MRPNGRLITAAIIGGTFVVAVVILLILPLLVALLIAFGLALGAFGLWLSARGRAVVAAHATPIWVPTVEARSAHGRHRRLPTTLSVINRSNSGAATSNQPQDQQNRSNNGHDDAHDVGDGTQWVGKQTG
jgi:hypothetical protein